MKTQHLPLSLLLITLLGGCAVKDNVVVSEPVDDLRARLRVAASDEGLNAPYRGVRAYPGSSCTDKSHASGGNVVSPTAGFEKTLNGQQHGMPITALSQDKHFRTAEFYAAANQPISLSYIRVGTYSTSVMGYLQTTTYNHDQCSRSVQFIPQANADYEIIFDPTQSCKVQVYQLVTKDGRVQPTPMDVQPAPACEE